MKGLFLAIALAGASLSAGAQELAIELSWDPGDFDGFEGGLVLPHAKGTEEEIVRSIFADQSRDKTIKVSPSLLGGTAVWTASRLGKGLYSFYVSDQQSLQGLSAPRSLARASLRVTVRTRTASASFEPADRAGAIWHVFDLIGEDGTIIPAGDILPQKTLVYGLATDAVTGKPIEGVSLVLKKKVDGAEVRTQTRADGKYMLQADFGAWTLSAEKPNMIGWKEELAFIKAEFPIRSDLHLSSILTDKQYRFVLSWGSSPRDLDAHAVGPKPSGGEFHISYRTMREWERRHFLDRDDTDGNGPETITLEKLDPGAYVFAVHDYSNLSSSSSSALSYSGAVARLYRERELLAEVPVPEGTPGTLWRVFELDGATGGLRTVNNLSFQRDPASVR